LGMPNLSEVSIEFELFNRLSGSLRTLAKRLIFVI